MNYFILTVHIIFLIVIAKLILMVAGHRKKEQELIRAKEELTGQNQEITALYEEMAAAEETLEEQFYQLQKSREEILRINDRYRLLYQAGNEGLWEFDYATGETYLSDRITEIYGYGPEQKDFMNRERDSLIHPEDLQRIYGYWRALNRGEIDTYDTEYRILHASGEYRWIRAKGTILRDDSGKNVLMAGSHGDIHERKLQEAKLYASAYHDNLTGIPNRRWFMEKLEAVVAQTIADHDVGAVLMLGMDDFRIINDAMGHAQGDEVLREIARRLSRLAGDKCYVARLSGDEFAVLLCSIHQRYQIEAEIQSVMALIHRSIHLNDSEIIVSASLGAVLFPKDASTADTIFRNGNMALEQAKQRNKNSYVFFDDKMAKENMRHNRLDTGLKGAFGHDEFMLHYQPIFSTDTRCLVGYEALVRWKSPEFGFVSPAEFIRLAEQNGTIVELGQWVLQESCRFINRLNDKGAHHLYVSVNLSPVQILQKDFVQHVINILEAAQVPPHRIVLEITETAMMESFDASYRKISALQEWGIGFSLDDFGTGYSSLNYLRSIPVKTVKIDRSFIDDLLRDQRLQKVVKAIIDISHDLGLTVVTEGVEEEEQLLMLRSFGCDCIQGYLLGRPVQEAEAMAWITPLLQERQPGPLLSS